MIRRISNMMPIIIKNGEALLSKLHINFKLVNNEPIITKVIY